MTAKEWREMGGQIYRREVERERKGEENVHLTY